MESTVGERSYRVIRDIYYLNTELRSFQILKNDVLPIRRPVRFQMVHCFGTIGRDLLRVVPLCIVDPHPARARPGSIHSEKFSVGRERWIKSIVKKFFLFARGKVLSPNVSALISAEHIAQIQFSTRLVGANEQNPLSIGSPLWLDVVGVPEGQLLRLSLQWHH